MNEVLKLNLPEEIVIKILNDGGGDGASVTVDNYLSLDSENPVQNKVITKATNDIIGEIGQCITQSDLPMYLLDYATNTRVDEVEGILSEVAEAISNKQDKVNITDVSSGGSIGLTNNMECRADHPVDTLTIVLYTGDDIPKDYVSYITFKTDDNSSLQFDFFATTQQSYLIKFIGDDCDSNYKFNPQPNTFYEVGFKYVGKMVTEENLGIPTYKHIFVARVGAF